MKIGAKIDLSNPELVKAIAKEYDFIEIYFSHNPKLNIEDWPKKVKYTMHTPHHGQGVNMALSKSKSKLDYTKKSLEFASELNCKYAVVHPGVIAKGHSMKNMIKNLKEVTEFAKQRKIKLCLETVPKILKFKNGIEHPISLPDEFREVIDKVGCGFCLDFSHASGAAVTHKIPYKKLIMEFLDKIPTNYFHLYNTKIETPWDEHYAFEDKEGNMDMPWLCSLLKKNDLTVFELPEPQLKNYLNAKKYIQKRGYY